MKLQSTFIALGLAIGSTVSQAAELEITVQNISHGMYFAPLLISAHSSDQHLYTLGEEASLEIQAMAEGGDLSGLITMTQGLGADNSANPAEGPMHPGDMVSTMLTTSDGNQSLSIVGMMVPSNDAFVGLDAWQIPTEAGTYEFYLNSYDAGTEANDEIRGGGAPGTPGLPTLPFFDAEVGTGGSGVTSVETNTSVHVHRGSIGDDDPAGGSSDLDNTLHRWLNPVAKVTVTVN
ncbi:spondin domain-containing protein [Neptunicella sp. SCSIO 80796]|uniref:spondin domain-containing protein n=1 Tax=Neptunicella plasticusilytica TaxID=3117012 RepID=UPI003A4DACA9